MSWESKWWKEATIYQVYPSTFQDSNNDGIGDIPGIISRLDYIKDLGVDVIWLSPHYKSPQIDMGYDISDYKDIYEKYGTLDDCLQLIKECHDRGMRIIFDLVINHTSDLHEWFIDSKSSKTSKKRDWYIWQPAKYDEQGNKRPPNNWESFFGGSAWEWDEHTQEYYLHLFTKEQPDINWRNLEAREAIYKDSMLFWLERGVDGFRIDVIDLYSKVEGYPDAPIKNPNSKYQNPSPMVVAGPQLHDIIREMNEIAFSKFDCMTVGEGGGDSFEKALKYVGAGRKEVNMTFQMACVGVGVDFENLRINAWKLKEFKDAVEKWQHLMDGTDGWTTVFVENHDQARSVSRFGCDSKEFYAASAKMLSVMLTTLSGTLFMYQGEEIGMINIPRDWPVEEYKDVMTENKYKEVYEKTGGDKQALKELLDFHSVIARDHARTPMQWDDSAHGGFSKTTPWMKANPSYTYINASSQVWDPNSVYTFWQMMLRFRKTYKKVAVYGEFKMIDYESPDILSYSKRHGEKRIVVVMNFRKESTNYNIKDHLEGNAQLKFILSSADEHIESILKPFEAVIYRLDN